MNVRSTAKFKLLLLGLQLTCSHAWLKRKPSTLDCDNFDTGPINKCKEPPTIHGTDTPVVDLELSIVAAEVSRKCQAGKLRVDMAMTACHGRSTCFVVKAMIDDGSGWKAVILECEDKNIQLLNFCSDYRLKVSNMDNKAINPYSIEGLALLENDGTSVFKFNGGTGHVLTVYYNAVLSLERGVSEHLEQLARPGVKYILSGYGLGGGLAVIARMLIPRIFDTIAEEISDSDDYTPQLMTFGAPKVGDIDFAGLVGKEMKASRSHKNQYLRFDICGSHTMHQPVALNRNASRDVRQLIHAGHAVILGTSKDQYYVSRQGGEPKAIDNLCVAQPFKWGHAYSWSFNYRMRVLRYSDPALPGIYSSDKYAYLINRLCGW